MMLITHKMRLQWCKPWIFWYDGFDWLQNFKIITVSYLHKEALEFPSLHLKEIFEATFFREFGGLELSDLLFSSEDIVEARQGKQLFGRMPQFSSIPSSLPPFSSVDKEISSRNTGCLSSLEGPSGFIWESIPSECKTWY